jgi:hypothetical protein
MRLSGLSFSKRSTLNVFWFELRAYKYLLSTLSAWSATLMWTKSSLQAFPSPRARAPLVALKRAIPGFVGSVFSAMIPPVSYGRLGPRAQKVGDREQ